MSFLRNAAVLAPLALAACAGSQAGGVRIAHLGRADGDERGFAALREAFGANNPGYSLTFHRAATGLEPAAEARVAFVQRGETEGRVGTVRSTLTVGDLVLLRGDQGLACEAALDLVVFGLPDELPADLPTFVRPDWDPRITDTPGGCATETGAYRRILLTWLPANGPYICHALNAHRVRITDSFTHYHPLEGGFDEFYLVQMVQPGARVLTSEAVDAVEARRVTAGEAPHLLDAHPLEVGDLVYLPRGTIHRGLDGVLAQVITTPGFRPGAEIGVDHHLKAINEHLGLEGPEALPYHAAASDEPLVR